jgi:hypothetical protein
MEVTGMEKNKKMNQWKWALLLGGVLATAFLWGVDFAPFGRQY